MTQLSLIEANDRSEHPIDVVERLASLRDWIFDRIETDEMSVSVSALGRIPCRLHLDRGGRSLHVAAAFDLKGRSGAAPRCCASSRW